MSKTGRAAEAGGRARTAGPLRVLALFGTRPEIIKLAPVIRALAARPDRFEATNVASGQHSDMLHPFARELGIPIHLDLAIGREKQTPSQVCQRILAELEPLLVERPPDALLVQGDTTTAFAGALAGFYAGVPVGHVEAGLRSGDLQSPFPEEANRRLISQLARFHFAATARNRDTLLAEGVEPGAVVLTGNPVVDSVQWALQHTEPSALARELMQEVGSRKLLLLTTHRRESFGAVMEDRLRVVRRFVEEHPDVALIFSVHPNPEVGERAERLLAGSDRVRLVPPLEYLDFVHLMSRSWLIVSDSGGVQEEACSLGRPLLVIRENTERPEAIEAGFARLVGRSAEELARLLVEAHAGARWMKLPSVEHNPFGSGKGGERIAEALDSLLRAAPGTHDRG